MKKKKINDRLRDHDNRNFRLLSSELLLSLDFDIILKNVAFLEHFCIDNKKNPIIRISVLFFVQPRKAVQ